ncbi:ComF family protein [Streptomyces sp. NPDC058657]|uniref:ComF family protein n=1 Tax=unclassified Streptomyces TaxID=2593676 RepID=UPI003656E75C
MGELRGWWREFAGLVLPMACGGCGRPREPSGVCARCAGELYGRTPGRVRPMPEPAGLPAVYAAARYEDAPRAVLLAHKERGALGLARPLGVALARAVRGAVTAGAAVAYSPGLRVGDPAVETRELVLVPVPSARRSVGARGHDPARRIALAAAGELRRGGTPARVAPVLRQRRAVGDQTGLGARERLSNLAGALDLVTGGRKLLADGKVVLVDDLMTTGASLVEAARVIGATGRPVTRAGGRPGPGTAGRQGPGKGGFPGLAAAVVAAPPKSFEINWN